MSNHQRVTTAHAATHRRLLFSVALLAILFLALRLRMTPSYDHDEFQGLYDELCLELQAKGDGKELYKEARTQTRKAPNNTEVLFFFQFIGIYSGELNPPKQLTQIEDPIRNAVIEGQFDDALRIARDAVFETEEMTSGRGDAWGRMIRELRGRWDNNCQLPIVENDESTL